LEVLYGKKTTELEDLELVLDKINSMPEQYRETCNQLHEFIMKSKPDLKPRLWYGMAGYAKSKSNPVLLFLGVRFSLHLELPKRRIFHGTVILLKCSLRHGFLRNLINL